MLVLDWASGGGLHLDCSACGLCLILLARASCLWLAPRSCGLRLMLLACASCFGSHLLLVAHASCFGLRLMLLACPSSSWLLPRSLASASCFGFHLVLLVSSHAAGFLLALLSHVPPPWPCLILILLGRALCSCTRYRALVSIKEAEGMDRGGRVGWQVLGP